MSEFKLQHHVSELSKLLRMSDKHADGSSSDAYAEYLEKNILPYESTKLTSQSAVKKLADLSSNPEAVYKKYEDLKIKNFREVDSLVVLFSEISGNEEVKDLLKKTFDSKMPHGSKGSASGSNVSSEKVLKIRKSHESVDLGKKRASQHQNATQEASLFPNWMENRRHLSWDFVHDSRFDSSNCGPLGVLPPNAQESRIIDDLLFCFVGVDGDYITSQKCPSHLSERTFSVDSITSVSYRHLVKEILPLASHYSTIIRFVEANSQFEKGLVNHALAAAIRDFLKEYFILISQLENQHLQCNLTLQKLWFYLQPTMDTMETIASIALLLSKGNCFGGTVLSVLHKKTTSLTGCSKSQDVYHSLTKAASVPYFSMLEKWIYRGIIADPYSEFLVADNELIKKEDLPIEYSDAYWEKRYTIRREQIPVFLEKAADIILRTGKYFNVIRQCGKAITCPDDKAMSYCVRESYYFECIETAYHFASRKLLDLLIYDADLKGRLQSVKHYFLLDRGDFIVQFMDMAEDELQKDIDDIMPTRLESLLELALRTSAVNEDKYKDDIRVELLPYDLLTQMFKILMIPPENQKEYGGTDDVLLTGLEAFAFDYEVKWPLSLVINGKALACYQMLFRHLFYCKHVERLLGGLWTLNKQAKILPLAEQCLYTSAFALRQCMLNFIENLDYYLTLEVIEPHWNALFNKISQVSNVDEVLLCHNDFLDKCLTDCMLTNPKLLQILGRLMKICVEFSNFFQGTMKYFEDGNTTSMCGEFYGKDSPTMLENFKQQTLSFEEEFNSKIVDLLSALSNLKHSKHTAKMIDMLHGLDFGGYYENLRKGGNGQHNE